MSTKEIKITFKKWLRIESAEVTFDRPLSIVQGDNATGKSSVKEGFDYLFGALVRGLARGQSAMLGKDGEKWLVHAEIYGNKFKASKSQVPKQDDVADTLKVSRKAMPFVTNPGQFLKAKQKDLKALLAEVLQLDFDWKAEAIKRGCEAAAVKALPDGIKEALKAATDTRAKLGGEKGDDGVGRTVNRAKTRSPVPPEDAVVVMSQGQTKASQVNVDDLGAGLKQLYEEKDALVQKRTRIVILSDDERKGITSEPPVDSDVVMSQGTTKASQVNVDELGAGLKKLHAEKDALVQKRARITTLTDDERKTIVSEIERLGEELKDAPDEAKLRPHVAEARHERDVLTKRQAEAKARRKSIAEEREKWERVLSLKLCAKCRKIIERELLFKDGHAGAIDDNEEKIDAQIEKLTGEIVRIDQELAQPGGASIMAKMNELQKRLDATGNTASAGKIDAEIKELEDRIDIGQAARDVTRDYYTALDAYKADQKRLNEAGNAADVEKIDAEIKALKDRIDIGQTARDTVRDYYTAVNAYKSACEDFEQDKEEWESWNKVCQEIPEIQSMAIGDGLTPFRKIIAEQNILDGDISLQDDLTIVYDGRPFSMASKAEQYIIALAPFFAMLELFKFPFCQVDNGDSIVSTKLKGRLFNALSKMSESKQVIFYQAKPEQTEEEVEAGIALAKEAGIGLYQTGEGTVTRIA